MGNAAPNPQGGQLAEGQDGQEEHPGQALGRSWPYHLPTRESGMGKRRAGDCTEGHNRCHHGKVEGGGRAKLVASKTPPACQAFG